MRTLSPYNTTIMSRNLTEATNTLSSGNLGEATGEVVALRVVIAKRAGLVGRAKQSDLLEFRLLRR